MEKHRKCEQVESPDQTLFYYGVTGEREINQEEPILTTNQTNHYE